MAKFNGQRGEKRNLAEMLLGIKTPKAKKRVKKMEPGGPAVATADPRVYDRSQGYISQAPGPSAWERYKTAWHNSTMADDSNLENMWEMVDPTGISSWDDAYRAYNSMNDRGAWYPNADEALDMIGALPILGNYRRGINLAKYATSPARYLANEAVRRVGPYVGDALGVFDGLEDMYGWMNPDKKLRGGETDPKGKGDKDKASSGWSLTPAQEAAYWYLINNEGYAPELALASISVTEKESKGNGVAVEGSYANTPAERIRLINGRFRDSLEGMTDAQVDSLKTDDRAFFNTVYANAAGNQGGDDGYNYRGRGLVQLTGRANYADASQAIFGDDRLVKNPDLLLDEKIAGDVAGWFLATRGRGVDGYLDFDPSTENLTPEQLQQVLNGAYATVASAGTLPKSKAVTDSMATRYGQYNVGMPKMQQFVQNNIAHLPRTQLASMPNQAAIDAERARMQGLLGYVDANNAMIDQQAEMYGNGNSYLSDGYAHPFSLATALPAIPQQPTVGQFVSTSQNNPVGTYLMNQGRRYGGVTKKLNGGPNEDPTGGTQVYYTTDPTTGEQIPYMPLPEAEVVGDVGIRNSSEQAIYRNLGAQGVLDYRNMFRSTPRGDFENFVDDGGVIIQNPDLWLDAAQLGIAGVGTSQYPGIDSFANLLNAGIYAGRAGYSAYKGKPGKAAMYSGLAGMSGLGAVPAAGAVADAGVLASQTNNLIKGINAAKAAATARVGHGVAHGAHVAEQGLHKLSLADKGLHVATQGNVKPSYGQFGLKYGGNVRKMTNGGPGSMMGTFLDVLQSPTIPGLDNESAINQALIRYYDMPDMQGLQPGQVPAAVSEYLNKGAMQNLAQTGVSALGSLFTANAPERLNAKYSFNDAMGGILSGAGAGMAFGPVGAAIGAIGGLGKSIFSHRQDQSLYNDQREEYWNDQIKMAESMVPQMNAMGYANYNQYGAPSTFAYGGNTQPDYETEKSEVILSSPYDRPIAMRGGSYRQLSNNLFKANGRSHANGGIPTKGATQQFVDNGGRQHQSPYVFSDSKDMRFDATNILKMIS